MKSIAAVFLLFTSILVAQGALRPDVTPPAAREQSVSLAQRLAAAPEVPKVVVGPRNPFAAPAQVRDLVAAPAVVAPPQVSDRRLLDAMAPLINPTGTMALGGQPILLFGQKRIKVGDTLPITFEGRSYSLVISAIQSTSFTVRLNNEETTRPINPASRP
jgi:hypothetical protein